MPLTKVTTQQASVIVAAAHTDRNLSAAVRELMKEATEAQIAQKLVDALHRGHLVGSQADIIRFALKAAKRHFPTHVTDTPQVDRIAENVLRLESLANQRPE